MSERRKSEEKKRREKADRSNAKKLRHEATEPTPDEAAPSDTQINGAE